MMATNASFLWPKAPFLGFARLAFTLTAGFVFAFSFLGPVLFGQNGPVIQHTGNSAPGLPLRVVWPTEPGARYELQESVDLAKWTLVSGYPTEALALEQQHAFAIEGDRRFFRVIERENGGPAGLVLIPAGAFQMGDSFAESWSEERPVHTVTLGAFYMATHETTKAQWDAVRTWGTAHGYTDLPTGGGKGTNHPVHTVSWNDIVKWCNAASERDGLEPVYRTSAGAVHRTGTVTLVINYSHNGYRMPSEAEWEKAARGGRNGERFPWGNTITHERANYNSWSGYAYDMSATRGYHPSYLNGNTPYTSPVGSFGPNGYGLYDMAGNVWELCNDWYGGGYYASSPSSDPRGPTSGTNRSGRGGSWDVPAHICRVAFRSFYSPPYRDHNLGFRLARSL